MPGINNPIHLPTQLCTGCAACMNACPTDAISMEEDENGFKYPCISEKCTLCKKCESTCPILNPLYENSEPVCYSVFSEKYYAKCSSGGAFGALSSYAIEHGWKVVGACTENGLVVSEKMVSDLNSLESLFQSKYVQSDVNLIYRQIKNELKDNNKVLFCGTPCQVAGLNSFLKGSGHSNNLYTIDLVCHGVPSIELLKRFLREETKGGVVDVQFRNKSKYGWNPKEPMYIGYDDNTYEWKHNEDNTFIRCFLSNLCLRKSCYSCIFSKIPRQGDLSIGDYWGYRRKTGDNKGMSSVLANNAKGKELIDILRETDVCITDEIFENIKQRNLIGPKKKPSNYKLFNEKLNNNSLYKSYLLAQTEKKYIGLVVMVSKNYGNNLTNWALFTFIKNSGFSPYIISNNNAGLSRLFHKNPYGRDDICCFPPAESNDLCFMYILGSDQTLKRIPDNLLNLMPWVRSDKFMITYSSSFGVDKIDRSEEFIKIMGYYLKRFDSISLRENSGRELLKTKFGIDSDFTIDPVFLLDKEHYHKMSLNINNRIPSNPYIGAYFIKDTAENMKCLHTLREKTHIENMACIGNGGTSNLCDPNIPVLGNAKINEFIYCIENCDYFITDSFHGVCFCLIFNKQFYLANIKAAAPTRIMNLLKMLNINDRSIENYSENNLIDYNHVNEKLDEIVNESRKWLLNKINEGISTSKSLTVYDVLMKKIDTLQAEIDDLKKSKK